VCDEVRLGATGRRAPEHLETDEDEQPGLRVVPDED